MKKKEIDGQLSLFSAEDFEETDAARVSPPKVQQPTLAGAQHIVSSFTPLPTVHYDHTVLFERLAKSDFRSGFHLKRNDIAYIDNKGLEVIRQHAIDFVAKRLAPAFIPNDGKQTPMRGHPVFLAQHATACCCRECFYKWHHIPPGRTLTPQEQAYAVSVLMSWIEKEYAKTRPQ